jgi:hypothetical protein
MNVISRVFAAARNWITPQNRNLAAQRVAGKRLAASDGPRGYFDLLKSYYLNNGLYDDLVLAARGVGASREAMKPLRNPAMRAVEVYASTLWPGTIDSAFEIEAENGAIIRPIEQVWGWSNWNGGKQVAARWAAMYGNWFCKVSQKPDGRPYLQNIEPQEITDFEVDERGYITALRRDTPLVEYLGEVPVQKTRTEYWSKSADGGDGVYAVWAHDKGDAPLRNLGVPDAKRALADFGIDFVPFVHAKLRDIGEQYGAGVYSLALDKIDEANRMATRLHQMLFRHNKSTWALEANSVDALTGRPLAPVSVGGIAATKETPGQLTLGDEVLLSLPGNSRLTSIVPQLAWREALDILNAQISEIERDVPELAYTSLREAKGELSGRAARLLLTDAFARIYEARGNMQDALARANMMALTMGANAELDGFTGIGSFDDGSFDHSFKAKPIIPPDETEILDNAISKQTLGVGHHQNLREIGYSDLEIDAWAEEDAATNQDAADKLLTALERRNGQQQ